MSKVKKVVIKGSAYRSVPKKKKGSLGASAGAKAGMTGKKKKEGSVMHFLKQNALARPTYQRGSKKAANLKAGARAKLMRLLNPKKK